MTRVPCDCPWDKSHCPHCGKDLLHEHVVGFGKQGHRDRCHRASVGPDRSDSESPPVTH